MEKTIWRMDQTGFAMGFILRSCTWRRYYDGAMWAYESLTFGGYWAWDPVENASLDMADIDIRHSHFAHL
ncbi:MAG: hypothetical protein IPF69_13920 [Chitinophagaceae bacterium]|nr:hypothetical protein [Chitinophagaceae bacterium]